MTDLTIAFLAVCGVVAVAGLYALHVLTRRLAATDYIPPRQPAPAGGLKARSAPYSGTVAPALVVAPEPRAAALEAAPVIHQHLHV
jgi:hypothetical protein